MTEHIYCGKIKHKTAAKAAEAARASVKRRTRQKKVKSVFRSDNPTRKGEGAKLVTYRCNVCGFFHWGHRTKKTKNKNKRR